MKPRFLPAALGLLTLAWSPLALAQKSDAAPSAATTAVTVFTGARLIDGNGGTPVENAVLVVQGERITAVGAMHEVKAPAGATSVSLKGKTIIPGLISAHSHLGLTKGLATAATENFTRENVVAQLSQYTNYGVTAVMSLGVNQDSLYTWRDEQRAGKIGGADIFTGDRGFGVPRGEPPFPMTPDQLLRPTTAEEARQQVQQAATRKPDMLKIWVDDTFGASTKMPPDIFGAIIDEAHKNKLRVAAHSFYLADAKALVRAGVDVIAHSVRDQPVDKEFMDLLKEKNVGYIPTLARDETQFIFAEHPKWMDDVFFTRGVDPAVIASWLAPEYAAKMAANPNTPKNKAAAKMGGQNVKTLFDNGVSITFGTDSGAAPTRVPGAMEHLELQLMVRAGLKPMDALVCATRNAATLLGDIKNRGTLEAGKRADFVVLNANPLDDITNTQKIDAVWLKGAPATVVVEGNKSASR